MKKHTLILITVFLGMAILIFTECKNQLDLKPVGQLDENTYYQNEKDFDAASLSPYSSLLNFYYDQGGQGWFQGILYPDDDVVPSNNSSNDQEDFNWNSNNGTYYYIWREAYKGIQRANVIISNLPKAQQFADTTKKKGYEAQARYLRAYFHFILASNYGNAPISRFEIKGVSEAKIGNSKPGEIWDFIIQDLIYAKTYLPATWDSKNIGRVTSGAAGSLLGKVYLFRAQWDKNSALYANAVTELTAIVSSGKYSLTPKFQDNFSPNNQNNTESIFEIQQSRGDGNPWLPVDFGLDGDQNIGAGGTGRLVFFRPSCGPNNDCAPDANSLGYGNVHMTKKLQNEFEVGDPRRPESIYLPGDIFKDTITFKAKWTITGSTPAKYVKQEDLGGRFPPNLSVNHERVIRYADVLLMLAEAKLLGSNDVAGAAALINQVRHRADPTDLILLPRNAGSSKDQMFKYLQHERRIELVLESHRYDDLVRWHRAGLINIKTDIDFGRAPANSNWQPKNLLKPIPQRELDLNINLKQNEGY